MTRNRVLMLRLRLEDVGRSNESVISIRSQQHYSLEEKGLDHHCRQ